MAVGPIPLTEIEAYIRLMQIDDMDDIEELIQHIRAMDSVYMIHSNKQNAKKSK